MEPAERSLESLLKWAGNSGISDSSLSVNSYSCLAHSLCVSFFPNAGGRGLGAVRDLSKGELVLRVPKSALMTTQSLSSEDERLALALRRHSTVSSVQRLIVCLLYEMSKGNGSQWFPYLKHVPRSFDILATFGEFEKQALQVDDAIWETEKAASKAQTEWREAKALKEELKLKSELQTFRAWLWAFATISSRALHIPWDEAGCLCPVGDLFNYAAPGEEPFDVEALGSVTHSSSDSTLWRNTSNVLDEEQLGTQLQRLTDGGFEEDVAAYCFYARKDYKKGEQVLLSYGTYTNLELLEYYGFLLHDNPNDKVYIPLEQDIYSVSSWPRESLYIHQNGKPSFALISALRLWATPPKKRKSVGRLAYSGSQLSPNNEMFIMKWISENCSAVLKNMPTSIEEDSLLLTNICKIRDLQTPMELLNASMTFGGEFCAFLEANGLRNEESSNKLVSYRKILRLMDKWELAVQWRLSYKKVLINCICNCTNIVNSLSSQNKAEFNLLLI